MGDRLRQRTGHSASLKRRKSFFRRIADSISSFVPTAFFTGNTTEIYDESPNDFATGNRAGNGRSSSVGARHSVRDSDTQTHAVIQNPTNVDVDLDAGEVSEGEMSAHSSTSGVSSLVPRTCAKSGLKTDVFSIPTNDPVGRFISQSSSAACSDAIDSTVSSSTFRKSSITPWILSHEYKRPDSPLNFRPSKRQRVSCSQSVHSFCDSERMSLFYRAKTTYGGASSCRSSTGRSGVFEPTTPLRFELEVSRQASLTNEAKTTTNLSSTARRILESLERFTTPLSTADRVPLPLGGLNEMRSTPFPIRRTFRSHRFPPYLQAYKRLKAVQDAKQDSSSSNYPQSTISLPPPTSQVFPVISTATPPISTLSSVTPTLAISTVSGFGFQSLPLLRKAAPVEPTLTTNVINLPTQSLSFKSTNDSSTVFTFAPPLRRSLSTAIELANLSTLPTSTNFKFSSPLRLSRSSGALQTCLPNLPTVASKSSIGAVASCSPIFTLITNSEESASPAKEPKVALPTFDQSKSWRCEACLLENPQTKQACSVCALPRIKPNILSSTPTNTSSNVDNTKETSVSASLLTSIPSKVSNRWECPVCMIFNEATHSKCIACGAFPKQSTTKISTPVIETLVVPETPQKWECPTCMVLNDVEKSTCPCCQTSKPHSTSQPTSQWECPTCMVFNSTDKLNCPCCSTPKPKLSSADIIDKPVSPDVIPTKPMLPTVCAPSSGSAFPFTFGVTNFNATVSSNSTTTNIASVVASSTVKAPFTPIFGNSVPVTVCTTVSTSSASSHLPTGSGSTSNPANCSLSKATEPPTTNTIPFQFGTPTNSVFTFGLKRPLVTETVSNPPSTTIPPTFTFGFNSNPKLLNPLSNGLPNGEINIANVSSASVTTTASVPSSKFGSGGFTFTTNSDSSLQPKLEFGSSKPTSVPTVQPTFTFGLPFHPIAGTLPNATSNSSVNLSMSGAIPKTTTPFVFGPTSSTAAVFSFGSGGQASKAPVSFGEPTNSLPFGQSNPTQNLFSANPTAIAARKKVHATRRLHR